MLSWRRSSPASEAERLASALTFYIYRSARPGRALVTPWQPKRCAIWDQIKVNIAWKPANYPYIGTWSLYVFEDGDLVTERWHVAGATR
jgi:hypothetical protein